MTKETFSRFEGHPMLIQGLREAGPKNCLPSRSCGDSRVALGGNLDGILGGRGTALPITRRLQKESDILLSFHLPLRSAMRAQLRIWFHL